MEFFDVVVGVFVYWCWVWGGIVEFDCFNFGSCWFMFLWLGGKFDVLWCIYWCCVGGSVGFFWFCCGLVDYFLDWWCGFVVVDFVVDVLVVGVVGVLVCGGQCVVVYFVCFGSGCCYVVVVVGLFFYFVGGLYVD